MTDITEITLVESLSQRTKLMEPVTDEKALEALNKAKSLVMATWHGQSVATTNQIAEFYEVPVNTIKTALQRSLSEFESDGITVVRGKKAMSEGGFMMSLPSLTTVVTFWTPRAALRLGMLLRDSEVAKQVRSLLLDIAQSANPAKQPALPPAPKEEVLPAMSLQDAAFAVDLLAQKLRRCNVDESMCQQWEIQSLGTLYPQLKAILPEARKMIQAAHPIGGGMAPMIPTDIARIINKRLGKNLKAEDINKAAVVLKWQEQRIDHGGHKVWDLTTEGLNFAKQYPFTHQQTGRSGTQIKWNEDALNRFEAFFKNQDMAAGWEGVK